MSDFRGGGGSEMTQKIGHHLCLIPKAKHFMKMPLNYVLNSHDFTRFFSFLVKLQGYKYSIKTLLGKVIRNAFLLKEMFCILPNN